VCGVEFVGRYVVFQFTKSMWVIVPNLKVAEFQRPVVLDRVCFVELW